MLCKCSFNKDCDRGPVIVGLAPDINNMIETHQIPDTASEVVYNQIQDIKDVGCAINDTFDAIILSRQLKGITKVAGISANGGTGSSQPVAPVAASSE